MVDSLDDVMALPKFIKRYPDLLSMNQLRWLYFHRETNGLTKSGAVVKTGGRLFVVVPRMRDFLLGAAYEK